jgi:hypothetical protein
MKIHLTEVFYISTKRTVTKSNYNINIALYRDGDRLPLIGTSLKNTSKKKDFIEWGQLAILKYHLEINKNEKTNTVNHFLSFISTL